MTEHHISRFEIQETLGRGGMGEVFRARDPQLGRDVAIKLLSPALLDRSDLVERFSREARAASALNHPNILTVFEIGEYDGRPFLVSELVDGDSLRSLLEGGALELPRAIDITIQIAGALEAAHGAGIVHRDIKPDNVMVRRDDLVKVLDFGLAKLEASELDTQAATTNLTRPGSVMGTAAYMSPEQCRGEGVDARTDLFSLGVVLYEMITGSSPFRRPTAPSTYEALLNHTPPPVSVPSGLPAELDWIVARCMDKDRSLRFQTASDLRAALESLRSRLHSSPPSALQGGHEEATSMVSRPGDPARRASVRPMLIGALSMAALLATLAATWLALRREASEAVVASHFRQLTEEPGQEHFPSLSPDGKLLVYAAAPESHWDVFFRRVGGGTPINLTADSPLDDTQPAFSPDGERVAFRSERAGGGVFVMGATGENVSRVSEIGFHPAWSPDGERLVVSEHSVIEPGVRSPGSQLWVIERASGERRSLDIEDGVQATWSPDGRRIAYWGVHSGGQRDVFTVPSTGGPPVAVTNDLALDWNPVWSPDGRFLYFASARGGTMNLWRIRVDTQSGETRGQPEAVVTPSSHSQHPAFSADGALLAYVRVVQQSDLQRYAFDTVSGEIAGRRDWLLRGFRAITNPHPSPLGDALVFGSLGSKQEDLFYLATDGTGLRRLTDDLHKDRAPRWSPDGSRILFFSDRSGEWEAYTIDPAGGVPESARADAGSAAQAPIWHPGGSRFALNLLSGPPSIVDLGTGAILGRLPATGDDQEDQIFVWDWSRDGRLLIGFDSVSIQVHDTTSGETRRLAVEGQRPVWLPDSQRFLFRTRDAVQLRLADSAGEASQLVLDVSPDRIQGFFLSPDGEELFVNVRITESDLWLKESERPSAGN